MIWGAYHRQERLCFIYLGRRGRLQHAVVFGWLLNVVYTIKQPGLMIVCTQWRRTVPVTGR